jgi:glycosyltransferase involved in cell wall biosynthesis
VATIGISLLTLVPGQLGGTETYVRELLRALGRAGSHDYLVFTPPAAPAAGEGLRTELVPEYMGARTIPERFLAMAVAGFRPAPIRRRLARAATVHYPLTIALPEARTPFATTLHDVLHLDRPELFPRAEALLRRIAYERSARRAARVIVPTEFVRERAVERVGLDPGRVRVVAHGIDHTRFRPADVEREGFLLYPARPWPHKNHARLFEALALLRRDRPELRLVLTGGGWERRAVPTGVDVKGLVSPGELVDLYRRAGALVFPSEYEGFGAPPLEAMACGCPVAASTAGAVREVCGDAAEYFDARDPGAIAAGAARALEGRLVERGLERAGEFTWDAAARGHDEIYAELL